MAKTSTGNPDGTLGAHLPLASYESGWSTLSFLADSRLTFPELFGERVREQPNAIAFEEIVFPPASGAAETRPFTYQNLADNAQRAAGLLESAGVAPGDRVLLCVEDAARFFAFFLGAQGIGAIPVPLPSASDAARPAAFRERSVAVAADCAPRAVVADTRSLELVAPELLDGVALVDATQEGGNAVRAAKSFSWKRSFDEVAFIQYTSGSTGKPKGVVVTHYNLVANLRASTEAGRFSASDRSVFWLPLYHDMGLIGGMLFGIYLGIPTFRMSARAFLSRPVFWLEAMSRWKGTFTIGPNFAYNLLSGRVPESALAGIDLTNWRLAFNGAEPIDKATVEAFIRRFEPYGFRAESFFPVYGMAETTLATAFPTPGTRVSYDTVDRETLSLSKIAVPASPSAEGGVTFVGVGRAMPGHEIVIRSPEEDGGRELPERHVGEIVAAGPSVTSHYYGESDAAPRRTELRTGDLGYMADGTLYIVDRLKDLVIVAGRNLVPSDIERVAATVDGVRYGAVVAFARPGSEGTEELYLVVGIEARATGTVEGTTAEIRRCIHERFGVSPKDIVLVDPRAIPKTSSGKIQRAACRKLYETGQLAAGAAPGGSRGSAG